MKISLIHPSRQRPQLAHKASLHWLSRVWEDDNVEYILSVDSSDPALEEYQKLFEPQYLLISDNTSAIEAINTAAKKATGDLFVVMSDDFECPPYWDRELLKYLKDERDFLVKTDDGCQPWIITLPIMDRKYYNRFNYVYNSNYSHMFADTEMSHVGNLLGRVITLPLRFPHLHYTQKTGYPKDAVNQKNDNTWDQGEKVYLERFKVNFGLKDTQRIQLPAHHIQWFKSKGIIV